jgi:hypothetical protein
MKMSQKESKSTQKKSKDYLQLSIKPEALNNINFSVADEVYEKDEAKKEKYRQQRFERGFDDTETWHLDRTMSLFIIPRLEKFMELNNGIANGETEESYYEKMNFIVKSLKRYYSNEYDDGSIAERTSIYNDARTAINHLCELWFHLWW